MGRESDINLVEPELNIHHRLSHEVDFNSGSVASSSLTSGYTASGFSNGTNSNNMSSSSNRLNQRNLVQAGRKFSSTIEEEGPEMDLKENNQSDLKESDSTNREMQL